MTIAPSYLVLHRCWPMPAASHRRWPMSVLRGLASVDARHPSGGVRLLAVRHRLGPCRIEGSDQTVEDQVEAELVFVAVVVTGPEGVLQCQLGEVGVFVS